MGTLNLQQAADFLQFGPETIIRNLDKWGLPHIRVRNEYFFSEESLLSCLAGPRDTPEQIETAKRYAELIHPISLPDMVIDPRRKFKMRDWKKMVATPTWVNRDELKRIYALCAEMSARDGIVYHVDHIVPIMGENVCGLHVPANLRIIPATENISKSNKLIEDLCS